MSTSNGPLNAWLRRARGAMGMGLTWAVAWAGAGILIGVSSVLVPWLPWHDFFTIFDAPLPALAIPGFFAGLVFSLVLGVVGNRRHFQRLSMGRFAAWGALGGVLLSLPLAVVGAMNLAARASAHVSPWQLVVVACGTMAGLSAASASGSLLLARRAEQQSIGAGSAEVITPARASKRERVRR